MTRRAWTDTDTRTLRRLAKRGLSLREIGARMDRHVAHIRDRAKRHGIDVVRVCNKTPWTAEMELKLREMYPTHTAEECAEAIGISVGAVQNKAFKERLHKDSEWKSKRCRSNWRKGLHEGARSNLFKMGDVPHNKGKKIEEWVPEESRERMRRTFFQCRTDPTESFNYRPIGSERFDRNRGVVIRKVSDDTSIPSSYRWRPVHVLVWEAANGPIPDGMICRFKRGMKTLNSAEITLDRLEIMTRRDGMNRNSYHNNYPKEVALLFQLRGALNRKIRNRTKESA